MEHLRSALLLGLSLTLVLHVPAAVALCGNGIVEAPEECDDGGACVGGTNAGSACTREADCQGDGVCTEGPQRGTACHTDADCGATACVHCIPFGGDGCAANCTFESRLVLQMVSGTVQGNEITDGTSGAVVHGSAVPLPPLPFYGALVLTAGKNRDGQIPLVIRSTDLPAQRVYVGSLACACVRGVAAKTCGGTVFEADGVTLSTDCTQNSGVCAGGKPCTFVYGEGNMAAGGIGCNGLDGADLSVITDTDATVASSTLSFSGQGVPGSAVLLTTTTIGTVVGDCSGTVVNVYGQDGEFCTEDDPPATRGVDIMQPLITGAATAVVNSSAEPTSQIGPFAVTGKPFSCDAVGRGDLGGTCLASALTAVNQPALGDLVLTTEICAQPGVFITPVPTPSPTATVVSPSSSSCQIATRGGCGLWLFTLLVVVLAKRLRR